MVKFRLMIKCDKEVNYSSMSNTNVKQRGGCDFRIRLDQLMC